MPLRRLEAPAVGPVDLARAKGHLRYEDDDQDDLIEGYAAAANGRLDGPDGELGRALLTQQWELTLECFPRCDPITVPLPPCQSVDSVKYFDAAGVLQTLVEDVDYLVLPGGTGFTLIDFAPSRPWPSTQVRRGAVIIEFTAGYGDAADVPAPIVSAILLTIGDLFEGRQSAVTGTVVTALPSSATVDRLVAPYLTRLPNPI